MRRLWLFNQRARHAVRGLGLLRRAYEHVLVMAVLEGARSPISATQTQPSLTSSTLRGESGMQCIEDDELGTQSGRCLRGDYYEGYVDALRILGGKAELIARQL